MSELLRTCAKRLDFAMLTDAVSRLGTDGEFRAAWSAAVKVQHGAVALSDEERMLMTEAIALLGTSDVTGEIRHCEQYAERLHTCSQQRAEELRVRGRLYVMLGLCGGCAVALLLV